MLKLKHIKKKEKVNKMKTETLETISEEFEQNKEIEQGKPMYTIDKDLAVVETDKGFLNPLSYDKEAIQLFLENNRYELERYFNDENNYGIVFYACGYDGRAQQEFAQAWADNGVWVF